MATRKKAMPSESQGERVMPSTEIIEKEPPESGVRQKELPPIKSPENTVTIGGKLIEIKPMKLKYIRNRTAAFRMLIEQFPLSYILAMDKTSFGDGRDGDKALYDWLVAVTDDEDLIRENYDEIDSDTIYKLLAIHRRIERIDELEAKLKNAETPGAKG